MRLAAVHSGANAKIGRRERTRDDIILFAFVVFLRNAVFFSLRLI